MKGRELILLAAIIVVLTACDRRLDRVRNFIPGTYVCASKGEFSEANDTLLIRLVQDDRYAIERRNRYRAIREGKLLPEHHLVQQLTGVYDPEQGVLQELTNGRVFSFDPVAGVLRVNGAVYCKVR